MRAFVGSYLDEGLQRSCAGITGRLVEASGGLLRAIPAGTAHLTHAFVAAMPETALASVQDAVAAAAGGTAAMAITLGAPAILYARTEARLIHLPVLDGGGPLARLAQAIAAALQRSLPDTTVTPTLSPHVTLARFRRGTRRREARDVEAMLARDTHDMRLAWSLNAVQVVESQLLPDGPRYVVRSTALLASHRPRQP